MVLRFFKVPACALLALAVLFGGGATAMAGVSARTPPPRGYVAPAPLPPESGPAIGRVYDVVAALPPELQNNERGAADWMHAEFVRRGMIGGAPCPQCNNVTIGSGQARVMFDGGKCAGGLAQAVASNVLAVGKALRVYKLIKDLGGVAKVADNIRTAFARSAANRTPLADEVIKVFEEGGLGLGAVALELLGIDAVVANCF